MLPGRQDKQSATASKHNAGADSEIQKKNEGETGAKDRLRIQSPAFRLVSSSATRLRTCRALGGMWTFQFCQAAHGFLDIFKSLAQKFAQGFLGNALNEVFVTLTRHQF